MKTRSTAVTLESGSFVLTFFFAILLFAVTNSLDAATLTVKVGYPSPSGAQLPVWVIPEAGIDQRYGLNVQLIFISGPARLTQTLVAGDVDLSTTGGAGGGGVLGGGGRGRDPEWSGPCLRGHRGSDLWIFRLRPARDQRDL